MIDIKLIRENPDLVKENIKKKFQLQKLPLVDKAKILDKQWRKLKYRADDLRKQRNRFEYQAVFEITETLLKNRVKDAEKLLEIIEKYIQEKNPQLKLEI